MKQEISRDEVQDRWIALRDRINNSIYPKDVARFLSRPESELTRDKILLTLKELANYRLASPDGWVNDGENSAQGDIVICEGLETFFVPAVEGSLNFQEFLEAYSDKSSEFLKAMQDDLDNLLERWDKKGFEGAPYIKGRLSRAVKPDFLEKGISLVESASMAIRVIIHFYTLVLRSREKKERRMSEFFEPYLRNKKTKLEKVFKAALEVTIESFQKGEDGKIGTSENNGKPGSGWSWCQIPGLPPMLYFTQCAVDAFTELDIYLIRPFIGNGELPVAMKKLYSDNEELLKDYQFCVDMSRRWVQNNVLDGISRNYGFYYEEDANVEILDSIDDENKIEQFLLELESLDNFEREKKFESILSPFVIRRGNKEKELNAPFVVYNSLYALTILLWSFGDNREDGEDYDQGLKAKIERAFLQIVINYRNYPIIKKILDNYPYQFTLPDVQKGEKVFSNSVSRDHQLSYEDSGFLTLLARLLVLFGVYGFADHSLLDPIIKESYLDLQFFKNRRNSKYPNLWSQNDVEVFSTFRAVQTLTFYYLYQQGKELNLVENRQQKPSDLFRYVADQLALIDVKENGVTAPEVSSNSDKVKVHFEYGSFRDFYMDKADADWPMSDAEEQKEHLSRFESFGDRMIQLMVDGKIDAEKGRNVLKQLNSYVKNPWDKNGKLRHEVRIEGLEERYFGS